MAKCRGYRWIVGSRGGRSARPFAALVAIAVALAWTIVPSHGQGLAPQAYLPSLMTPCSTIAGARYGSLSVPSPSSLPPAEDPDLNLTMRGWQQTNQYLGLVTYNGTPDPNAPQLWGLFADSRVPTFSTVYQVYDWNWSTMTRGALLTTWPVTLAGMQVQTGEVIQVPPSGYTIGSGYNVLVLYATNQQITLKYTRDDNVVYGYTVQVENVCVDPALQTLFWTLTNAGSLAMPALTNGQPFGYAIGTEIQVAIRDSGSFMDPRSHNDWWQGH